MHVAMPLVAVALASLATTTGFRSDEAVDLALLLAVDVSSSMSLHEQRAQRDGYISAFRHPEVQRAIGSGGRGKIAVAYLEWAGPGYQRLIVPWTVLKDSADAARFAGALSEEPLVAEAGTSISHGLAAAGALFGAAGRSDKAVVDISGDGPNNAGPDVEPVRDRLVADGVTINGLAIALPRDGSADRADGFGTGYLTSYYERCVIGGPGAFVIDVESIDDFEVAIRRKLVLEIAGPPGTVVPTTDRTSARPAFDCATIGSRPGR
jgi:hypothetical protein